MTEWLQISGTQFASSTLLNSVVLLTKYLKTHEYELAAADGTILTVQPEYEMEVLNVIGAFAHGRTLDDEQFFTRLNGDGLDVPSSTWARLTALRTQATIRRETVISPTQPALYTVSIGKHTVELSYHRAQPVLDLVGFPYEKTDFPRMSFAAQHP